MVRRGRARFVALASALPFILMCGCNSTEVELSKDAIESTAPPPVPVKEVPKQNLPPGGGGSSSGNSNFNPGANS